jgi:hypothetical protein
VGALALALGLSLAARGEAEERRAEATHLAVAAAVDRVIDARLAAEGKQAAPRTNDEEFLRRLTLDLLGTVPTVEEVRAFGADRSRDKRARKIDELLASEAYAEHWADWWYKALTGLTPGVNRREEGDGGRFLAGAAGEKFHAWLSDGLAANRPFDELAYDLVTATGRTDENGAAAYTARWDGNPNNLASAVARNFLGVRIQCAQCHDHVYEESWKQKDFQGMATFFALTRQQRVPEYRELRDMQRDMEEQRKEARERGEDPGEMRPGRLPPMDGRSPEEMRRLLASRNVVEVSETLADPARLGAGARLLRRGAERNPELGERAKLLEVTPKFWMGSEAGDIVGIPRRLLLARWITSDDNPYFAQTLANRMWGALLGRGFVDPVDDFNSLNPPSHPEALEVLAGDVKASGYDLKRLLRVIVSTEAYQRSSRAAGGERPDPALFAVGLVRPLTIEQLYNALSRASGAEQALSRRGRQEAGRLRQVVFSAFSFVFDDDEGTEQQDFEGSIPQGLFLMNGELMSRLIEADGRRAPLQAVLEGAKDDAARVTLLYLRAFGREPSAQERSAALSFAQRGGGTQGWEDLFWALLNSAEFMTNH